MSAVDEIRDAIDKLEREKAKATPGPWFLTYERATHPRVWGDADDDSADPVAQAEGRGNAELIVTLHRTIDAQLTALRMAVDYLANGFHEDSGVPQIGIGIARAINGATS